MAQPFLLEPIRFDIIYVGTIGIYRGYCMHKIKSLLMFGLCFGLATNVCASDFWRDAKKFVAQNAGWAGVVVTVGVAAGAVIYYNQPVSELRPVTELELRPLLPVLKRDYRRGRGGRVTVMPQIAE